MSEGFKIEAFLKQAYDKGASDIHLKVGKSPAIRISNNIVRTTMPPLTEDEVDDTLRAMLHRDLWDRARTAYDLDFTYEIEGLSRFRVNYCKDLGYPKLTIRIIPYSIPTFADLHLPESLKAFTTHNNGIVLITGATGSGKSTTIASLLEYVNEEMPTHIITIEDPVEFLYTDKQALFTQRHIGIDIKDFPSGVKYALRQDPDIIVIGEIRDRETLDAALNAAETGHLVFSTLHTNSAIQTINRIVNMYDDTMRHFARERIAHALRGTVAQKLLQRKTQGRVPALEIMSVTPAVKDYIMKNQLDDVYELIKKGGYSNMTTMNTSIFNLYRADIVSKEEALAASDEPTELGQLMRGVYHGTRNDLTNDIL